MYLFNLQILLVMKTEKLKLDYLLKAVDGIFRASLVLLSMENYRKSPQCNITVTWLKELDKYYTTEPKAYHLSYSINKHDAIDIADPNGMNGRLSYATRVLSHHARDKMKNIFLRN